MTKIMAPIPVIAIFSIFCFYHLWASKPISISIMANPQSWWQYRDWISVISFILAYYFVGIIILTAFSKKLEEAEEVVKSAQAPESNRGVYILFFSFLPLFFLALFYRHINPLVDTGGTPRALMEWIALWLVILSVFIFCVFLPNLTRRRKDY